MGRARLTAVTSLPYVSETDTVEVHFTGGGRLCYGHLGPRGEDLGVH